MSEISGALPITFNSTGDDLTAWSLTSASERLGIRVGKNYLKQTERTMPDGTYGKRVYTTTSWSSARTGTFNSGQATAIGFNFCKVDNGSVTPANVGKMYIVEGSADPETDGVEIDVFQGGVTSKGDSNDPSTYWVLRFGDDGSGNNVIYSNSDTNYIPIRCGTAIYRLKPNTDYNFERVGGDSDVKIQYVTAKESADLDISWKLISSLNSIPSDTVPNKNTEQWTLVTGYNRFWMNTTSWYQYIDSRPATYEYCAYYADLKAGHYKVVAECYGSASDWGVSHIYNDQTPYMALISEDNTQIIAKRSIFQGSGKWHHEEYEFTITSDTKVGLYFKAINKPDKYNVVRFGIFDYDTPNVQFTVHDGNGTLSGVSCWEPYKVELPITVQSSSGDTTTVNVDLCADYIYPGRTVTSSMSPTVIPTYYGRNVITCDLGSPVMYAQYNPLDVVIESRPGVISVYDISEPQLGYQHNGLAILMPSEVTSDKEDKGRWELTLKHPIDQYGKWTYTVGQNVLKVNGQLFRIVETEMYLDAKQEYIAARAKHISYDMADYWVNEADINASNGTDYVLQLMASRVSDFPNQQHIIGEYVFDVTSDLDGPIQNKLQDQSIISALFGSDNSLASFGGQVYRDNFHVSINKRMEGAPEGHAFAIRYGTDLTKISFKIDFSEWITNLIGEDNFGSLVAVWYDTSGDWLVHHHKTKRVHFTYSDFVDADYAVNRLDKDVTALWGEVSTPKISIVVGVAAIKNDPKYKEFVGLQNYDVGYTGTVYVEHLGIDVEMRIVSVKRNELTGEAIQITLGNTRSSLIRQTVLSQTIVAPNAAESKMTASMQRELDNLQLKQMSTWSGIYSYVWSEAGKNTWEDIKNGKHS